MNKTEPPSLATPVSRSSFQFLSQGISLFVIGIGCLVLLGWTFNIPALKSIVPGLATMKSLTAFLFVLLGLSLGLRARQKAPILAKICAFLAILVGVLTIGEYLLNQDFHIDQLLFRDTEAGVTYPGRMAPATAFSFVLMGLALFFHDAQVPHRFKEVPVITAFAISVLALVGYLYGVSSLYRLGAYTSMAVHTALSFALLSLGISFSRSDQGFMKTLLDDTAGGLVMRRFLPTVFLLPVLVGWLRLWGQRAGLYDTTFGVAIMVISLITLLTISIWAGAQKLTEVDRKRRQIDEALRNTELRYGNILENMIEGCQIIGYDWRYLYLNDSAVKQSRFTREQLLGRTLMECYPGLEHSALFMTLQQCIDEHKSAQTVTEFTYPDGSRSWFDLSIQPTAEGIFILSSDITMRQQAEQALVEHEMKLTKLLDILPVGISILNAERQISFTNPALGKILAMSEEGLQNRSYAHREYFREDGSPLPLEEMASTVALRENREVSNVETGVKKEDGTIIWTSVSAVPVHFPDWKLVLVTVDITERKQAEQALRESEHRYSMLFHKSAIPAALLKLPDVFIIDANEALERLVGFSRQEMYGKTAVQLGLGKPAERKDTIRKFEQQGSLHENEVKLSIRSGEERIVLVNTNPFQLGGQRYAITSMQDVTKRKQAEREILQLNIELEQKVLQRTAELAAANEQLQQLSILDELTGLHNRRGFLLLAEEQVLLAKRARFNLLVFYADLDGLKQINDQQGHHAGDKAIVTAANALNKTFRASDIKARLGGDEFIVLAIEAKEPEAPILVARLHHRLARQGLSMSVGFISLDPQTEIALTDFIARADEAMYAVKMKKPGHRKR